MNLGRQTNQTLVQIPHARFIEILTYKARLVGIEVVLIEESYTSKASFLDLDALPTYDPQRREKPSFSGKRERRGLYRVASGRRIHADVNASYNILLSGAPRARRCHLSPMPAALPPAYPRFGTSWALRQICTWKVDVPQGMALL